MNSSDNRKHMPGNSGRDNPAQERWNVSEAVRDELTEEIGRAIELQRQKSVSRWPWRKEKYSSLVNINNKIRPADTRAPTQHELQAVRIDVKQCRELSGRNLALIRYQSRAYRKKGFFGKMWARLCEVLFDGEPISVYKKIDRIIMLREFHARVYQDPVAGIEMYQQSVFPGKVSFWDRLTEGWRMVLDHAYSSAASNALQQARKDIDEFHPAFRYTSRCMLKTAFVESEESQPKKKFKSSLNELQEELQRKMETLTKQITQINEQCQRFLDAGQKSQLDAQISPIRKKMAEEENFVKTFCWYIAASRDHYGVEPKLNFEVANDARNHFAQMEIKIEDILNGSRTFAHEKYDAINNLDLTGNSVIENYLNGIREGQLNQWKAEELLGLFRLVKSLRKNIEERKKELIEQDRMQQEQRFNFSRLKARLSESREDPFELRTLIAGKIQKLSDSIIGNGMKSKNPWEENLGLFSDILLQMKRRLEYVWWIDGNRFEDQRKVSMEHLNKVHLIMLKLYHPDHHDAAKSELITNEINIFENNVRDIPKQTEPPAWLDGHTETMKNQWNIQQMFSRFNQRQQPQQQDTARNKDSEKNSTFSNTRPRF